MKELKGIALIFLFAIVSQVASAIPNSTDSLRISIRNLPDDTLKVIELADLSKRFLKYQIDTSYSLAQDAVKLSKDLDHFYSVAYSYKQLGLVLKYKAEYDSAMVYYNKSMEMFNELGILRERSVILNRIANIQKRKCQFQEALESFLTALNISIEQKDTLMISALYNNLGILYSDMGNYDKALDYQLLNLSLKKAQNSYVNIPIVLMNIGNIYSNKNLYEEAIEYYKEALAYLETSDYKYDQFMLLHNMGTLYESMDKYQEALKYYNKALILEKEMNDTEMQILSIQGIGNVLIKTGNFKEGVRYLEKSHALANEIGDLRKIHLLSANLYKEYEKHGDYLNSFKYLKNYVAMEDSTYTDEGNKELIELEQKYEAEKRERQIAFLEKERQIQVLELEKREIENKQKSFQRNVLIIAVLIALMLTIYFGVNNKRRKKINELLIKQNKKIVDQRTEITKQNTDLIDSNKTKDKLFQIIAHDLRSPLVSMDSITQLIPYWVEEQDYDSLMKLSKTLELSVKNVLSLIDNLLNWALDQQGKFPYKPENMLLKDNILEAIDVYKPIAEIKNIDLRFTYTKDVRVFADRNMLFTVMRNLLNNAVKLTPEKGEITIGIGSNVNFAKVWVKDSGIGIPKEKKEEVFELANGHGNGTKGETGKGLGLFFCKEFVKMNNGDIFIESQEGMGTTITFTLPLFNLAEN